MEFVRFLLLALLAFGIALATVRPVVAKDEWTQVRSKNFFLIGNASEKDIRKVATRLEQFRESISLVFNANLTSSIPTNVVVFKGESSYNNFKPKRPDGSVETGVAGYFLPGEDVNYITLSTEGDDETTYEIIFHEYVHFIVDMYLGRSNTPAWFNEGLAEYFSTFAIEDKQKVKLGLPDGNHLYLLKKYRLMPLGQLFGMSRFELRQRGNHSRSIFYAQSWALIHYLFHTGKDAALIKFLSLLSKNATPEQAFQGAFQTDFVSMERELRKYVEKGKFQYSLIMLDKKLVFDAEMSVETIPEASSNTFLGGLLYRIDRVDDAERFLVKALDRDVSSSMANTMLGMVKIKQNKFDEAKTLLERAISIDQRNYSALYQYAFVLSLIDHDEARGAKRFDPITVAKMRDALRKAIAINPRFTKSYDLLALINLVSDEELDDAVTQIKIALKYQPGNEQYSLRLAEIFLSQKKYSESLQIAEKIAKTSDSAELRSLAENLIAKIAVLKQLPQ